MEELDYNVVRHLLGPLADDFLDPPMPDPNPNQLTSSGANSTKLVGKRDDSSSSSFNDQDPLQELWREAAVYQLANHLPLSRHYSGGRINDHGLKSIGSSNQFASSNRFIHGRDLVSSQHQEGVLVARYERPLMQTAASRHPGSESSVAVMEIQDENSVDDYFLKLVDIGHLKETMTDPVTSKEFQKLVGRCKGRLREEILVSLRSDYIHLLEVCCHPHGIRSIRKLFEYLGVSYQRYFAATTLSTIVTSLFKDVCGQEVIDFCLRNFSNRENERIFFEVEKHLLEIADDQKGCWMLTKCMQMSNGLYRDLLFKKTAENSPKLAVHPFGNYLVQKLFQFNIPRLTDYTLLHLRGSYHVLSTDKHGSHVVEKCLSWSSRVQFEEIMSELMGGPDFTKLFADPYGNYVVQSMLSRARECRALYDYLRTMIESKREELQCNPHASKVLQLIGKQKNRSRFSRFHDDGR